MLGFMAVSGIFGLRNLQGLDLLLQLPDEIYCNTPAQAVLQITVRRRTPGFLLRFHLHGASAAVPFIPARTHFRLALAANFPQRGNGTIRRLAVTSPFPVNFFVRSVIVPVESVYTVFPEPRPLAPATAGDTETARGEISGRLHGGSGDLAAISAYTGREPLKLVHWKLAARHDDLFVRELQSEQGTPVIINADELPGDTEERLGHAVFLINSLMASGRAVGLILAGKELPPATGRSHRLAMLGRLADHAPA
jgi:uncharacterized protein (DUF58 family)